MRLGVLQKEFLEVAQFQHLHEPCHFTIFDHVDGEDLVAGEGLGLARAETGSRAARASLSSSSRAFSHEPT